MSCFDVQKIVQRLRDGLHGGETIALHEPVFQGNEWLYVKHCLDTRWVSSVGEFVTGFEQQLAAFTGAKHAIATVNGTAALHTALLVAGIQYGDEVLAPALTFVATANALSYCGAVPHFVDIDANTLGVDPKRLSAYLETVTEVQAQSCINRQTGRPIKALVVMHAFGHPADLDALRDVCAQYKLKLIEDAAESLGSYYKGKHTGTFGLVGVLSFNGNKIITTGGGGAVLTNDSELAEKARHLTTTAKLPHPWEYDHNQVGYNYRLPNINAAIGLAQLEQINGRLQQKHALAKYYQTLFSDMPELKIFMEPEHGRSNYWLNLMVLGTGTLEQRNSLLQCLHERGILARPVWQLMHRLPMYKDCPHMDLSVSEDLINRIICLPSSSELAPE
jgi:perosamine synthetase